MIDGQWYDLKLNYTVIPTCHQCVFMLLIFFLRLPVPDTHFLDLRLAQGLKRIVSAAAEYGVTVMVEDFPSPLLPMCDSAEMRALLDGAPGLKLVLDTGNTLARKEDPVAFAERFLGDFVHVHLKDI